jgi:hypothetical protein
MRNSLIIIMIVSALVAVALAGIGSWSVLGRTLAPLATITDTVDQISRADLSESSISSSVKDEVGSLV